MTANNLAFIKKWQETYKNISQINSKTSTFRITQIHDAENPDSCIELQLSGKNICFKYTRQEILADIYLYNNLSPSDQKLIENLANPKEMVEQRKIELLEFKKAKIDSINTLSDVQIKHYIVTLQFRNEKQTYQLTAKEILQNKTILNALSNEEKIEIAFNAGIDEVNEEQQQMKELTKK